MKNLIPTLTLAVIFLVSSCQKTEPGYITSENGLQYRMVVDNKQAKAKEGELVQYTVAWRTMKDSLILNTANKPMYGDVVKPYYKGDPNELLAIMGEGDSATCMVPIDSIARNAELPSYFKHGDMVKIEVKVLDVLSREEYDMKMQELTGQQANAELSAIQKFIASNNLKAEKKPSGLFVVISSEGKGNYPMKGQTVMVNYAGRLIDGAQFDSSLEPGRTPLEVTLGQGQVIKGWDEGLMYFKVGSKGQLIIPSNLGYGEQGNGPKIPPNSTLVFDIELVEIK